MATIEFRLETDEGELLDASDDIRRMLDEEGELSPPVRALLLALDDAITDAFSHPVHA